ncbi:hypothetical protein FGM00_08150 [Aggregatimonas sangjinii]|uniref:HEAT repeat domain-containing protein n=1 Tax=Aggregatimonas sangjinii TaxID=2583587 RepID=A0A5B7SND3_9FLAO|nr:hypothetical protein [Aggregatimonas sangjinii]QCX00076.1 hypothetical protein FGM00_08150 [Aggregatimonas sangjinii]
MRPITTTYQAISLLQAPKIDTAVLWNLSILLGSIALVYFTAIFFFRNKITGKARKVSALKVELSPMISEFIFYDEDSSKEEKSTYINLKVQIRDMIRDDFTRKVVSEILLDLRKDVSGSAQERLFELFQDLDLHKESYRKLKSWRWEHISSGIEELTRMEVSESYEFITKFINDKRSTIRKQAEIGVVSLNTEGIDYFLDTTTHRISEWQQLKLLEVLSNKTQFEPPSFMAWLTSTNKYVVLFALRLIKYYDQNDAKISIVELVKHRDNQIKQEAIDCIKAFYIVEALPTFKKVFWSCSTNIKISILGAIGELGAPKDVPFLNSIGNKERSYSVTSKALSAINAISPETILPTKGIADIDYTEIPEDLVVEDSSTSLSDPQEKVANEPVETEMPSAEAITDSTKILASDAMASDVSENKEEEEMSALLLNDLEKEALLANENSLSGQEMIAQINDVIPSVENNDMVQDEIDSNPALDNSALDIRDIEVVFSMELPPRPDESTVKDQNDKNENMETLLNDIDVTFEEVLWKYIPKEATTKSLDINNMLVVSTDLDFLPIVIDEEVQAETPTFDLNNIEVAYQMVSKRESLKEDQEKEDVIPELIIDPTEIEFVPVNEVNHPERAAEDIEVIFEEIMGTEEAEMPNADIDVHFDVEIEFKSNQPPLHIQKMEASKVFEIEVEAIEVATLSRPLDELDVICEIVQNGQENEEEDLPLWLLNEIAKERTAVENYDMIEMEGPEWENREQQMMDKIKSYFNHLPESEDVHCEIVETVQLLDDISLFGDEREIPFLQELLKKEDKTASKARIEALMKRFMGSDVYGAVNVDTKPYSVFEELFRNCDTESKLILLDEIVSIGDEKEIYFLEQLVDDSNKKIQKKAQEALQQLKERYSKVESANEKNEEAEYERLLDTMALMPPRDSDMFEIDFELTPEENPIPDRTTQETNWFTALINKFIKNQPDS